MTEVEVDEVISRLLEALECSNDEEVEKWCAAIKKNPESFAGHCGFLLPKLFEYLSHCDNDIAQAVSGAYNRLVHYAPIIGDALLVEEYNFEFELHNSYEILLVLKLACGREGLTGMVRHVRDAHQRAELVRPTEQEAADFLVNYISIHAVSDNWILAAQANQILLKCPELAERILLSMLDTVSAQTPSKLLALRRAYPKQLLAALHQRLFSQQEIDRSAARLALAWLRELTYSISMLPAGSVYETSFDS